VIETVCVSMHPAESVTVNEYVPAQRLKIFCVVAPLLHRYVKGEVPPEIFDAAVPVHCPLHKMLFWESVAVGPLALFTTAVSVCVQSLASVMVIMYVPAGSPVIDGVVWPLLHKYA
jgi:hypothetical protein